MLNRNFVVSMVQSIAINNTIGKEKVIDMVSGLEEAQVEEFMTILDDLKIRVVEDDTEETELPSGIESFSAVGLFEVKRLSRLSNEELCVMFQRGDRIALDALTVKNKRLVYKIACRCFRDYRPDTLELEDLYIEGNLGLTKAAEKFEVQKNFKFSTYACWWIYQAVTREILNAGFTLRLPVHVYEDLNAIRKCRRTHKPESIGELQTLLAIEGRTYSMKRLHELLMIGEKYTHMGSLNELVGDENDTERMDFIPATVDVEEEVTQIMMKTEMSRIFRNVLNAREWDILQKRYGLNGFYPMTLEQIGKEYGVTRERIRQIEKGAMSKIRCSRYAKNLREYIAA